MKYIKTLKLLTLALLTLSFSVSAQTLDDGTGYNEFRQNVGVTSGSLTTNYTFPDTSKRKLETVSPRCANCFINTEISSLYLTLNADLLGTSNLYKVAALRYTATQWLPTATSIDGIVFTASEQTHLIEHANTADQTLPGARMRVVIFPITGSPITTPFVDYKPNGRTIIPTGTIPTSNILEIHVEFWNFKKLRTQFKVETLDVSNPGNSCTQ